MYAASGLAVDMVLLMLLYWCILDKIYRVFWQSVSMTISLLKSCQGCRSLAAGSVLEFAFMNFSFKFCQVGGHFHHKTFSWWCLLLLTYVWSREASFSLHRRPSLQAANWTSIANVDFLDFFLYKQADKVVGVLYELPALGSSVVDPSNEHQVDFCRWDLSTETRISGLSSITIVTTIVIQAVLPNIMWSSAQLVI